MKYYITTPIYYVNDKPHIGHAYTTVVADVLARWRRQQGDDVFYLTGTDEHGTKVAQSAEAQNKSPQEFCDEVSQIFKDRWQNLNISNDHFIRTTDKDHKERVKEIFTKLKNTTTPKGNEVIYAGEYKGLYCTGCEKFLTDKEIVDGKCPDHKTVPEELSEKNYFFRLSDYKEILEEKIKKDEFKILPISRKNEALALLDFIDDFSVSRETVKWGIDLPFDKTQKSYVWVDALSNYITAIGYPDKMDEFNKWWPADAHLMAQDILKFHAIYWPAMLLALDIPLPKLEYIHGFFTIDGQKMSKSLGNVIDPDELVDKYGIDPTRYLLLSQFSFGQEADIQAERFPEKYNADLANGLGNLVARISNLLEKNNIE
ncbi:MAG: methionine--tRNA ligase, partial [Patescibacteria group bacterium]